MSLALFLCLCCWLWAGMYLLKYRFLFKSFVFHASIVFNLQFDTCSVHFSFVFLEILFAIAVLERYIRKILFEWNLNFWSRQDYPLEILVLSKYSFIRIYFQSGDIPMKIVYASVRCGFRIPATSEVEMFLRIVNSFQLLTFVTRTLF